jgi:hypothetical protein
MVRGRGTAPGVMSAGRADGGVYRETARGVKGRPRSADGRWNIPTFRLTGET